MNKQQVTFEGQYILALSEGEKHPEQARQLWEKIVHLCIESQCFKVLGMASSNNAFSIIESFQHYDLFKDIGITNQYKVAWVETNPEAHKTLNLIETVLRSRGISNGRLFTDLVHAKRWLLTE